MDRPVTVILLVVGFSFGSCSYFHKYFHYIALQKTWAEAQGFCREKYTDLATIESTDDLNRLNRPMSESIWMWIGLRDDPESWYRVMGNDTNSWRWSSTGQTSRTGFQNWAWNDPNNQGGRENCVMMIDNGQWCDVPCEFLKTFVCYTATRQNEKTYVFISDPKTWRSARAYCREHHTDLATIESKSENHKASSVKPGRTQVWIGLYRVPWTWSDNSPSSFRLWEALSPNNGKNWEHCVAENAEHKWNDLRCEGELPFICHQVSKLKTTVRMKIETRSDFTDPDTSRQILQQFSAALAARGWTDFSLRWTRLNGGKRPTHAKVLELM
ncbi:uncharacterized protein V6R79_005515 [Siganus canaliculatus]